jgi:hypothetical protein
MRSRKIQEDYMKKECHNSIFETKIKNFVYKFSIDKYYHYVVQLVLEKGIKNINI